MIQIPGPIPLTIHPFFWVFAGLIGWINSGTLMGALIWIGIIFVSVLIHEYGHALTAILFRQKARIQLVALGGVTLFEGPTLKFWQQFLITFNGPFFGFLLFLFATFLLQYSWPLLVLKILKMTQIANLFWTVVNLLPVLPLDGGQLLRIILEAIFGVRGFKASLLIGTFLAFLLSLYFFLIQAFFIGAFFFLFAYQSFETWRKSRFATLDDRNETLKELLIEAENALQEGDFSKARPLLEEVRSKTKRGLHFFAATQYLAFLEMKEGRKKEAYKLLLPIKEHLSDDTLCILHELAAEEKNYPLVIELSAPCYQWMQSQKMALNNARAFAYEHQAKAAGGWLQTAWQFGGLDLPLVLEEKEFQQLKDNPEFKAFVDPLK